jgi:L-ascorbate metabolism protein UlaG (beta-lactamase superfamily)
MARVNSGLVVFALRMAPTFWRRVSQDLKRDVVVPARSPQIAAWTSTGIHATWIGHSTVLLSIDGFTILTDPVFSKRIGLGIGPVTVGFKRLVGPAISLREIPTPDLILLSHAHMDHFDLPTLRKLENPRTTVITAASTRDLLRGSQSDPRYAAIHELRWNETTQVGAASIHAFEVRHWGARMRSDTQRGYNGYVIEAGKYRVVFGGDTAFTDSFKQIRTSRTVDLAIMPIGAYDPWIHAHCTPEQALAMANHAGAEFVLPVHHRTFQLSREPDREPLDRLLSAAGSDDHRICIRDFGDEFHLP